MSKLAIGLVASNYANGWIGTIESSGTKVNKVVTRIANEEVKNDPRVFAFAQGTSLKALVDSYLYNSVSGLGEQGSGLYGVYDPTQAQWGEPIATAQSRTPALEGVQQWGAANPYGLASVGDKLYLLDYDTAAIYEIDMADGFKQTRVVYEFPKEGVKAAGTALAVYGNALIAVFVRYTNVEWQYDFKASALVKIPLDGSAASSVDLAPNANNLTIAGDYAYVPCFGGAQQPGGNGENSKLVVVALNRLAVRRTIAATSAPSTAGDVVDVEISGEDVKVARILFANYNADYSEYSYQLIQTDVPNLLAGNFGGAAAKRIAGISTPAGATWGLFPAGGDQMYFVAGNEIQMVDTTKAITDAGAVTSLAKATDFEGAGSVNTAAVVVAGQGGAYLKRAHVHPQARHLARVKAGVEEEA